MARRKLPDRPPNGIGAGQKPRLVPRPINVDDSISRLTKPFKVPLKSRSKTVPEGGNQDVNNASRSLRKRSATISYAGMDVEKDKENDARQANTFDDDFGDRVMKRRRVDALSARRLMEDPNRLCSIETALKKSFHVPIKGYVQRHSLPSTLGMKIKVIPEPRPLHDPSDEFAIVLYDPSVDGDMIIQDHSDTVPQAQDKENKAEDKPSGCAEPKFSHPKRLSNGLKNKSLKELLGVSPFDPSSAEKKKFANVPVVIDPKLAKILRPHQVEGVKFLYRCVTGLVMKDFLEQQLASQVVSTEDNENSNETKEQSPESDLNNNGNTQGGDTTESLVNEIEETDEQLKKKVRKKKNSKTISKRQQSENEFLETLKKSQSNNRGAYGCIMADEMGLGKTLQCIALMWTLLRQGPQGKRLIDKCIIVCPSSLVNNWANELVKWLGPNTVSPLAVDGKKSSLASGASSVAEAIKNWAQAQGRNIVKPVLIISYDTLRRNVSQLNNCEVGLLLADEGHRLKNGESLTFTALDSINCPRRVILSGTPIQNDLSEYFALLNFSNPGLLGTRNEFRRNFELPILQSRDADATDSEISHGEKKLQLLSNIVSKFIIRRTNDILSKYLPCKYEHVIFVNLSPFQKKIYNELVKSREVKKVMKGVGGSQPLKAIGVLKKICNHPDLINLEDELDNFGDLDIPDGYNITGSKSREVQTEYSGKFAILERFLYKIKTESNDKIVLISNYTQTLDLIERMCRYSHYSSVRLDGTMSINKRQKLVDRFNDPEGQEFIFLLSSKAGGCGINLIGANRLILMDPDWNPASDQQALARVWRDGQKKDCFIYRFISTGTIEEKIYQRQSMKMSLSSCVVDAKEDVERLYSVDNLRQLFQYNEKTICETHETYQCKRCNKFGQQITRAPAMLYGDATTWNHLNHKALEKTNDHLLKNEHNFNDISYAFQYISH
ncbi:DNA repair and recombination protein RAD54 [Nakaseomyces bracarensis]|uniref:DNA helicase n=1 Tax=Nakaseomyces bracarensis TaxID=273131 RepID=A0ABR4NVS2_9SACH